MNKKNLIMFMPTIETGGVEKNFVIIANFFAKKLKNISVITTNNKDKKRFSKKIRFISQNILNLKNSSRRFKFLIGIIILFKEILKDRDSVVFCFQANIYCTFLCKLLKTKIIVRSNSSPTGWSKNIFKKLIYKKAMKMADKVIVNSLEFKDLIKQKFDVSAKCIYNPLNQNEILSLSKKKIKFPFFKNDTINFINVSRLENQKDHLTLLEGFSKIKFKYKLLLIGNGKNKYKIEKFISENNITNNIKILFNIENPFTYIKKSDILILSSLFEGLPNILLEAACLKKLIISSDCSTGPKEILDHGKGGILFKTNNSSDLFKKLNFVKKNRKKLNKKINYAYRRIGRFNYDLNLNNYFKLIDTFLVSKNLD